MAIVLHDSRRDLEARFVGQLAAARELGAPLVCVDNDSRDGGPEMVRELAGDTDDVAVIRMGRNAGYAAGVNAALAASAPRDLMLINPDVGLASAAPVWALEAALREHPSLAIAGPRLVHPDGQVQPTARRYPTPFAVLATTGVGSRLGVARRARERYLEPSDTDAAATVDWVMGAAMLIRRAAAEAVGPWDERFFLYVEDVDFCLRCVRAGWEVGYFPEITLEHGWARLSRADEATMLGTVARRHHVRSFGRLWLRNPSLALGRGRRPGRPLQAPAGQ